MTLDATGRVVVTTQGYVKTLHDDDGDGRADRATRLRRRRRPAAWASASTATTCSSAATAGSRATATPTATAGPTARPSSIVPLAFAEHGGHAMRKGPDGCWYVDRRQRQRHRRPARHARRDSPIRRPRGRRICPAPARPARRARSSPTASATPTTSTSTPAATSSPTTATCERDYFLPWYTPTRLYPRRLRRPPRLAAERLPCGAGPGRDDYLDTVDILWPIGRGSPTGVACYRHDQFPEHYRGGLFVLDWTFGKVYFLPAHARRGELYDEARSLPRADRHPRLRPDRRRSSPPTARCSISIGGRRTRGAVYRIEYVGGGPNRPAEIKLRGDFAARWRLPRPSTPSRKMVANKLAARGKALRFETRSSRGRRRVAFRSGPGPGDRNRSPRSSKEAGRRRTARATRRGRSPLRSGAGGPGRSSGPGVREKIEHFFARWPAEIQILVSA